MSIPEVLQSNATKTCNSIEWDLKIELKGHIDGCSEPQARNHLDVFSQMHFMPPLACELITENFGEHFGITGTYLSAQRHLRRFFAFYIAQCPHPDDS